MIGKEQTRFYCYPATVKNQNLQKSYLGDVVIFLNLKQPIGVNAIGIFCRLLAKRAGVVNWRECRNHSWRAFSISQNAKNPVITLADGMGLSRHKNADTYLRYIGTGKDSEKVVLKVPMSIIANVVDTIRIIAN